MAKKNEALLAVLTAGITASGATVAGNDDLFAANLPEGITIDQADKLATYSKDFVSCGYEALGKAAIDVLKSDKKLDVVTGTLPMGPFGAVTTTTTREHVSTPPPKEGEKPTQVITLGSTRMKVDFSPATSNEGISGAKSAIKAYGAEVLAKKK